MGCRSSSSGRVAKYTIKIEAPNTEPYLEFHMYSEENPIKLSNLMNLLSFDPNYINSIDANFISRLNKRGDRYLYYVEKLIGISMEDEERPANGKTWVVYVNEQKKDWTQVCESDFKVFPSDEVLWRFEENDDLSDDESYISPIKY